ncbi:MAG TPA: undecaprenyl-diphosphate phosphatase [Blastocatellia bacterium]|jgi:undecaprenyl-diphosphatase|nr:undecaprenyl-diphosphate phosphatase [Blastocatellia bacterium]
MSMWQAILLGLVQGLTEFIPISSTAHLTITGKLLGVIDPERPDEWTAFIAVIQLGTLLAVLVYFRTDIFHITRSFITSNLALFKRRPVDGETRYHASLGWYVILGTIPVGVIGLLFKDTIEGSLTKNLRVIAFSLIGLAVVLTVAEIVGAQRRDMKQLTAWDALVVGFAQAFALIPGSSRSGSTITGGLFMGLTRETAARFSFLLSIPAIAASGLLELPKALKSVHTDWGTLAVATLVAAISGYLSIEFLLKYLQKHTTFVFVGYRIVLGLVILGLLAAGKIGAN